MNDPLGELVKRAVNGDRAALEELCTSTNDLVYRLALRMFSNPADAADATQEAMIRIVTNLSSFQGRSKFSTWAYTVASRQFLRMRATKTESSVAGSAEFAQWVDAHRSEPSAELVSGIEFAELCGDVRISCTYGMLLCLSRDQRLAYLLGDVVGMTDQEGAVACEVTPAAFRQRLARARTTMRSIIADRCGLVRSSNPCRCSHLVQASIDAGILVRDQPTFARHPRIGAREIPVGTLRRAADELDLVEAVAMVYRSDPEWSSPDQVMQNLRRAIPMLLETSPTVL
jgi:RNA polymerase sigma factor (sigma-70 family)